jgi:low affinity Fe/Cu permease
MTPVKVPAGKEPVFNRVADYVSAAMGRPANIMVWLVLVVGWTSLFAAHIVSANANFLPAWFTGTAFNFPLNLVTTVAELFIGFLVAAAANRSERNLELTLAAIAEQETHIEDVETKLSEELASNTALTQQVHKLGLQIHALLTATGETGRTPSLAGLGRFAGRFGARFRDAGDEFAGLEAAFRGRGRQFVTQ